MEKCLFINVPDCPICDSKGRLHAKIKTINHVSPEYVELRLCTDCRHQWINPLPTQKHLSHLYESGSPDVIGTGWPVGVEERGLSVTEARVLDRIEMDNEKGLEINYLEIGVGYGALFKRVKAIGIRCYGVEPGLWGRFEDVYPSLEDLPVTSGFDIFVCLDVLEHLENPVELLKQLRAIANPGAKLYCHFPNAESLEARLRNSGWPMYRPYGHLHFFSRQSSVVMLKNSGWENHKLERAGVTGRQDISSISSVCRYVLEHIGQGDQWFVEAKVSFPT